MSQHEETVTTIKGLLGVILGVFSNSFDFLPPVLKIVSSIGGIVLVYFSIKVKILQYRELKNKKENE